MDLLRRYLASNSDAQETDACDIVDKLVDRFQSAIRTEDRRDSLRTLKALSKKYRLEVGTKAMPLFIESLRNDREDTDSVCYSLESLYSVMNDDDDNEQDSHELLNVPTDLGCQLTEIFIKKPENVTLVMGFVDTYEVHIRRSALRLLTVLLNNQLKETQKVILQCPRAISKLIDLLSDPREALRNDALLLLLELTKSHVTIQKIVAFENTFERLFIIMQSEGWSDGGVVVEDCLNLLFQLLDGNSANQILFKENGFVQRLLPLLDSKLDGDDHQTHWLTQKIVNVHLTMQVIRALVSPRNKSQNTRLCQTHMYNCGLLSKLCGIIMTNSVPSDVLTKAIYTLADTVRGCQVNQDYLTQVIAPSEPPQPIITILLISMVNERQALTVRTAALYCFQCYVHSNTKMQSAIVTSMLSRPPEASAPISVGQLLCGGLFSNDAPSSWFSSIAFSHCIQDNVQLKEDLLCVHLATGDGGLTSVSLLQQCFSWFQSTTHFQTKIGLLQLMCTWLAYCPAAVRCFILASPPLPPSSNTQRPPPASDSAGGSTATSPRGFNLSTLISEVSTLGNDESDTLLGGLITLLTCICILFNPSDVPGFDRKSLIDTLEKRMGLDVMLEQLNQVSKLEAFIAASRAPEPEYQNSSDLIFDYSFTKLFKRLEYEAIRAFHPLESGPNTVDLRQTDSYAAISCSRELFDGYEQKLAAKDQELHQLRSRITSLESELAELRCHAPFNDPSGAATTSSNAVVSQNHFASGTLNPSMSANEQQIRELQEKLSATQQENELIKADRDDLLVLVHDQDSQVKRLRRMVKQLGGQLEDESNDEDDPSDICDGH
ncbi:unnamed protein product [Dicrocoelium dendriticum]|nr:unnamed protein product [Dicrocoelium dendriticum]